MMELTRRLGWLFWGIVLSVACQVETVVAPNVVIETPSVEAPTAAFEMPIAESEDRNAMADADVTYVRATQTAVGVWSFQVTVAHPDTGWEDYADGWDVVLPDGMVLKPDPESPFTRLLLHPHENEQPFTRSQSNIQIPTEITQVSVRAHDSVHGFGGKVVVVDLTAVSGPDYEIER